MRWIYFFLFALISTCYAQSELEEVTIENATTYQVSVADLSRVCTNCLRKLLKYGFDGLPILPIPPLDPSYVKEYLLKLDSDHARGQIYFSEMSISEFSNFAFETIDETHACFKDDPNIPGGDDGKKYFDAAKVTLQVETDYEADINLMGFIPVFGEGHIDAKLNLILATFMRDTGTSGIQITDFKACLDIPADSALAITGLQGDEHISKIIGLQLKDIVETYVNKEHKDDISNQLVSIKMTLNKIFGSGFVNGLLISILDPLCGADEP